MQKYRPLQLHAVPKNGRVSSVALTTRQSQRQTPKPLCTSIIVEEPGAEFTARINASSRVTIPVAPSHDPGCELHAYSQLPVAQFVLIRLPLGGSLDRTGPSEFHLVVPRLEFFGFWVQPHISCTVRQESSPVGAVIIRSTGLTIRGSDFVTGLRLQDSVRLDVTCRITFADAGSLEGAATPGITSEADFRALVRPPSPFSFIPLGVLEATGNAAIRASLHALQRTFVTSLAEDYERWATDEDYRAERRDHAAVSDELLRQAALDELQTQEKPAVL